MNPGTDYIGVSVGAMIINDQDEVLLCKRSQNASNERGCWENPGGKVHFGETLEIALRREIMEELGIEVEVIQQLPADDHLIPQENQHWVATTFIVKTKPDQTPVIQEPDKCDEIKWFPLNTLPSPLSLITQHDLEKYQHTFVETDCNQSLRTIIEQTKHLASQFPSRYHKQDRLLDAMEELGETAQAMLMVEKLKTTNDPAKQRTVKDIADGLCDLLYNLILLADDYGIDYPTEYQDMLDRLQERLNKGEFVKK